MIKFGTGNLRIPRYKKPGYGGAGGTTDLRKHCPAEQLDLAWIPA